MDNLSLMAELKANSIKRARNLMTTTESWASWYLLSTDAAAAHARSIVNKARNNRDYSFSSWYSARSWLLTKQLMSALHSLTVNTFFLLNIILQREWNIHVGPVVPQEEEIPELEIDIDELLELTDEGQRSRLQVSLSENDCFINLTQLFRGQPEHV